MVLAVDFIAIYIYHIDSIYKLSLITIHMLKKVSLWRLVYLYRKWKWLIECLMSSYFEVRMDPRDYLITIPYEK